MKMHNIPFVVYGDFECFIKPIDHAEPSPKKSFTVQYQKHSPSGYWYTIICVDESVYKTTPIEYTMQHPDEDIGKMFVESLESKKEAIHNILKKYV